ncbi:MULTISPECIES: hypothetical protein [unclassified Streptomyces]|uniref:hypothetical protein n=1 Tax=unclassified Streptomyces TaxID=2593676 RepID=UPI001F04C4D5|nr:MULTISPECIES: hypothetical protein [unclassified Streptomyces]MCH0567557.1 hypothetical protein [Streptomyces sp. MUM 2J]MCH0573028.1 hypothetical protein [Streptomyces sp. MUM 136J]
MTDTSPGHVTEEQAAALTRQIEGYLRAQRDREQARAEAEAFCARLPWLTSAQAEDVARHYAERRLELTRQTLRHTVRHAGELRREYEARYAALRHRLITRHVVVASTVVACATVLSAALCLLGR